MRRLPLALALFVPLAVGASARADETPKPGPGGPPPPAKSPAEPAKSAKPIAWVHDYEAAKTQAAAEKKGLFVYLTPNWFT